MSVRLTSPRRCRYAGRAMDRSTTTSTLRLLRPSPHSPQLRPCLSPQSAPTRFVFASTICASVKAPARTTHLEVRRSPFLSVKNGLRIQWLRFLMMAFTTSSITMGFDKCPFIPASKDACTSSAKAFAVIAMMGIVRPSGRSSRLRMALVAS